MRPPMRVYLFVVTAVVCSAFMDRSNGIQDAVWEHILNRGEGTLVDIAGWEKAAFEQVISKHPKAVIRFAG